MPKTHLTAVLLRTADDHGIVSAIWWLGLRRCLRALRLVVSYAVSKHARAELRANLLRAGGDAHGRVR